MSHDAVGLSLPSTGKAMHHRSKVHLGLWVGLGAEKDEIVGQNEIVTLEK